MFIRRVAKAMIDLDPTLNPQMRDKINRLTYLHTLPAEVFDAIECPTCKSGDLCNSDIDVLYVCPLNPMKQLVVTFTDRYIGNPFNTGKDFELNDGQLKLIILGLCSNYLGILCSRGFGKSVSLALIAIMWAFFNPKGEKIYIIAPTTNQTDQVYSYIRDFLVTGKRNYLMYGDPSIGYEGVEWVRGGQKPEAAFKQGTFIRPRCASKLNEGETVRGQQPTFAILDESSYIDDRIYLKTIVTGMGSVRSDHENIIIESGTPDGKNHFYNLFHDRVRYKHYTFIKLDYSDGIKCGRYDENKINEIIQQVGGFDSEEFKTEYRCMFPESTTTFFRNLEGAFSNTKVEVMPMPNATYYAGVDLGRVNDSTVLTIGRYESQTPVGDRIEVVHIVEINPATDTSYPEQYEIITNELKKWRVQRCWVDHTGPGIPAFESLVAIAANKNLSTSFIPFVFTPSSKYGAFLRLRNFFQTSPVPRVTYPMPLHDEIVRHPDGACFIKAEQEFRDIIQKRNFGNIKNEVKYYLEPAKSRGHDDYVSSGIVLSQGISDYLNNEIAVVPVHRVKEEDRGTHRRDRAKKNLYSKKNNSNIWRQL